ncbi:MAG: MATE family efflux transporter [Anaerolineales bacterium]|nr:MATE family efflux transporter [Anaerolineales bacterium]
MNQPILSQPHPFQTRPDRTLVALSVPVMLSFTAEPVTALVDTAFIASLGVAPLAAVGVGATALSSLLWVFNFLGVSTQTEVAQAFGKQKTGETKKIISLAFLLAGFFGLALILLIWPSAAWVAELLGGQGTVQDLASIYMRIRIFGIPGLLIMSVSFGAMRGIQDMRTPLWIALAINLLNLVLDWVLIFGIGPFPAMGVAGSALASTISQSAGAIAGLTVMASRTGLTRQFLLSDALGLIRVGGDLFLRTGVLNIFLLYTTRAANQIGADAGAAHQVIRQVYIFTALAMDAFASTVQSLVGYYYGQNALSWARKAAWVGVRWSLATGAGLGLLMWLGHGLVIDWLVPASSLSAFLPAWAISAASQPLNSLAFLTDGAHMGTGDYHFLRNAMIAATLLGVGAVWLSGSSPRAGLSWIWVSTALWVLVRAGFGLLRIWPGIGKSDFQNQQS